MSHLETIGATARAAGKALDALKPAIDLLSNQIRLPRRVIDAATEEGATFEDALYDLFGLSVAGVAVSLKCDAHILKCATESFTASIDALASIIEGAENEGNEDE